jgi:hypothetical protein
VCLRYPLHRYSRLTSVTGERYPLSSGGVWAPVTNSDPVELALTLLLCGEPLVRVGGKPNIGTSPSGAVYRVGMMLPITALISTLYSGLPADHPAHQSRVAERSLCYNIISTISCHTQSCISSLFALFCSLLHLNSQYELSVHTLFAMVINATTPTPSDAYVNAHSRLSNKNKPSSAGYS